MGRPLSHRQKYRIYNVTIEQAEARWQCQTCTGVIEHDDAIYCRHCRMYWEDVSNGLFDFYDSDGGVESGHANASGSGPLPEPIPNGDACSALEPPHQAAETVGRYQELKRAAGVTTGPSETTSSLTSNQRTPQRE